MRFGAEGGRIATASCSRSCSARRLRCTCGDSTSPAGRTSSTPRPAKPAATSWKAFLFGSLDTSNFITVDKPPASLWVMDLSVRLFGVNSWSLLVPQALEGVATVALVYAAVKRVAGSNAGLLAGAILATTPVATLMFRFDNPDALLVLLLTASAYAMVRALEDGRLRWLALAGTVLGLAFLTKMLQAVLVVPGLRDRVWGGRATVTWSPAAPICLPGSRALVLSAGWWVALVELWPAGSRPYIGGTNGNSILELIFGYNGIGRLDGTATTAARAAGQAGSPPARPVWVDCSAARWAARSAGCCRLRSSRSSADCG